MEKLFVSFATATAKIAGKPWTFIGCVAIGSTARKPATRGKARPVKVPA